MKSTSLIFLIFISIAMASCKQSTTNHLKFPYSEGEKRTLKMPDGEEIHYTAYEKIYYVSNIEDENYQYLNLYIPDKKKGNKPPIFLRTYVGGYFATVAKEPSETDSSGRALAEGYVVCIPGTRGSNSVVEDAQGNKTYTGVIPNGLLDLKAVVRYLRHNSDLIPGNTEKIITNGTSAGGAMSALLGATGNHPIYIPYLQKMGAANTRDDVFASIAYCPITDLENADAAYEWLYANINPNERNLNTEQQIISKELANSYPAYLNSLNLKDENGQLITAENYAKYLKNS